MERHLRLGSVPLVNLHKLPNLRAMTTVDPRNIVCVPIRMWRNPGIPVAQPRNMVFIDRYEIGTTARYLPKVEPLHLEFAIGAIRQSTAALLSLILHHSCEVIRMWPSSPSLPHLRKLVIARPYQGVSRNTKHDRTGRNIVHQARSIRRNDLATWVKELPSLHTLEITQSTDDGELLNLLYWLKNNKYPNLKELYLKRVLCFAADLRQFIFAHMDDLESLTHDTPAVFTPAWETLKENIVQTASASCHLQLTGSPKPRVSRHNQDRKIRAWWDTFEQRMIHDTIATLDG